MNYKSNIDEARRTFVLNGFRKPKYVHFVDKPDPVLELLQQDKPVTMQMLSETSKDALMYLHVALYLRKENSLASILELQRQHNFIRDDDFLTHYYLLELYPIDKFLDFIELGIYTTDMVNEFVSLFSNTHYFKKNTDKINRLKICLVEYEKKVLENTIASSTKAKTLKI